MNMIVTELDIESLLHLLINENHSFRIRYREVALSIN